ncbi:MAG: molybdenum cofactor guanylyltransferase [Promethearchaeota archaeon]
MNIYVAILAGGLSKRFGSNKALINLNGKTIISTQILEILKLKYLPKKIFISIHNEEQFKDIKFAIIEDLEQLNQYNKNINADLYIYEEIENGFLFKIKGYNIECNFIFDEFPSKSVPKKIRAAVIGLYSVFKQVENGYIQLMPCDMPLFNAKIMELMYNRLLEFNSNFPKEIHSNRKLNDEFLFNNQKYNYPCDLLIPKWKSGFIEPLNGIYKAKLYFKRLEANINNGIYKISKIFSEKDKICYFEIEKELYNIDPQYKAFLNINRSHDLAKLSK